MKYFKWMGWALAIYASLAVGHAQTDYPNKPIKFVAEHFKQSL